MSQFQRKRKLINHSLQLRLIGVFLLLSLVAVGIQTLLLTRSFQAAAEAMPSGGAEIQPLVAQALGGDFLWTLGFLIPALPLLGLGLTHRVAGPAYRMSRYLEDVAEKGQVEEPCRLRGGDELTQLVGALNQALDRIQRDRQAAAEATS